MDADYTKRRRESEKSRREKRWSMNSQRLEEIVAELMRPIIDVRRSFDTDLSALLEEYLTEAGLHALEESEEGGGAAVAPNFTEAALLLQQSANNYGRKVDYLYQHVLSVSDSLHSNMQEATAASSGAEGAEGAEEAQTPSSRRRRGRSGVEAEAEAGAGAFGSIALEASAGARREAGGPRPPPTLPRMYIELEPRQLAAADAPLLDYAAEPIGLLADFQVTWRLQDGLLVDELEGGCGNCTTLRALPLDELQAAIAAAAPPSPPPAPASPAVGPPSSPDAPDAPDGALAAPPSPGAPAEPAACSTPLPQPVKKERKRRRDVCLEYLEGDVSLLISPELQEKLRTIDEFRIPEKWITRVVRNRKIQILNIRQQLREMDIKRPYTDICSFDISKSRGFPGWAAEEAAAAAAAAAGLAAAKRARRADESDDDGFFDQSSLGDSDDSANHHHTTSTVTALDSTCASAGGAGAGVDASSAEWAAWAAWRDGVVARAAAAEARGFTDVRAAARALLAATRAHTDTTDTTTTPAPAPAFRTVLADVAHDPTDVSRMFLATLFLANAGNIEIIQGPPLTVNSFSVRLVTDDERRYGALAAAAPPPS